MGLDTHGVYLFKYGLDLKFEVNYVVKLGMDSDNEIKIKLGYK